MTRSRQRTLTALALVAVLTLVAVATQGLLVGLACAAPLLALALPLFSDRGEHAVAEFAEALARRRHETRRVPAGGSPGLGLRPSSVAMPRGGHLMAFGLAVRPPPRGLLIT